MIFGDHGRIRTLNLLIRSQVLYPVELRSQIHYYQWITTTYSLSKMVYLAKKSGKNNLISGK